MYDWTKWLDHVTDPSNRYTMVDNGDGHSPLRELAPLCNRESQRIRSGLTTSENRIVDAHLRSICAELTSKETGLIRQGRYRRRL